MVFFFQALTSNIHPSSLREDLLNLEVQRSVRDIPINCTGWLNTPIQETVILFRNIRFQETRLSFWDAYESIIPVIKNHTQGIRLHVCICV